MIYGATSVDKLDAAGIAKTAGETIFGNTLSDY